MDSQGESSRTDAKLGRLNRRGSMKGGFLYPYHHVVFKYLALTPVLNLFQEMYNFLLVKLSRNVPGIGLELMISVLLDTKKGLHGVYPVLLFCLFLSLSCCAALLRSLI